MGIRGGTVYAVIFPVGNRVGTIESVWAEESDAQEPERQPVTPNA